MAHLPSPVCFLSNWLVNVPHSKDNCFPSHLASPATNGLFWEGSFIFRYLRLLTSPQANYFCHPKLWPKQSQSWLNYDYSSLTQNPWQCGTFQIEGKWGEGILLSFMRQPTYPTLFKNRFTGFQTSCPISVLLTATQPSGVGGKWGGRVIISTVWCHKTGSDSMKLKATSLYQNDAQDSSPTLWFYHRVLRQP